MSGDPDEEESSRRRVLALLLTAVLALIGAGAGVSNFLDGDEEETDGVDLSVDYTVTPDERTPTPTPGGGGERSADEATDSPEQPDATTGTAGADDEPTATDVPIPYDADDPPSDASATTTPPAPGDDLITASTPPVSVENVEPGDGSTVDLSLTLSGSPARLWVRTEATDFDEGGTSEAERSAGDTGPPGELQRYVEVRLWYDADGTAGSAENVVYEGSLAGLADFGGDGGWVPLTEACVTPGDHTATLRWELPGDAPNVVQTDAASFSLGIAADTSECA